MNLLFQLFFDFFKIGLFSIGGGYAIIPAIRDHLSGIYRYHHYITDDTRAFSR